MIREMYQLKPLIACTSGRASDMISTYLVVKKYSIEGETNEILRNLFYKIGVENATVLWYGVSLSAIPAFYTLSKLINVIVDKATRKSIPIWKEFYNGLMYGYSLASFYTSVNNFLVFLGLPHTFADVAQIFGGIASALPVSLYGIKVYRNLKAMQSKLCH